MTENQIDQNNEVVQQKMLEAQIIESREIKNLSIHQQVVQLNKQTIQQIKDDFNKVQNILESTNQSELQNNKIDKTTYLNLQNIQQYINQKQNFINNNTSSQINRSLLKTIEKYNQSFDQQQAKIIKKIFKHQKILVQIILLNNTLNITPHFQMIIEKMGATVYKRMTSNLTCIICSKQITLKRYEMAKKMNIPMVNVLWIIDSYKQKKKLPYKDYEIKYKKQQLQQSYKIKQIQIQTIEGQISQKKKKKQEDIFKKKPQMNGILSIITKKLQNEQQHQKTLGIKIINKPGYQQLVTYDRRKKTQLQDKKTQKIINKIRLKIKNDTKTKYQKRQQQQQIITQNITLKHIPYNSKKLLLTQTTTNNQKTSKIFYSYKQILSQNEIKKFQSIYIKKDFQLFYNKDIIIEDIQFIIVPKQLQQEFTKQNLIKFVFNSNSNGGGYLILYYLVKGSKIVLYQWLADIFTYQWYIQLNSNYMHKKQYIFNLNFYQNRSIQVQKISHQYYYIQKIVNTLNGKLLINDSAQTNTKIYTQKQIILQIINDALQIK